MPRAMRADYAGAFHHVTNRGNHGAEVFRGDEDRRGFLAQLAAVIARQGWRCHGYCLMDNHYHLLLETPDANLARGMQWFAAGLSQRFNRRHGLAGHLFQGRYSAVVIERESHLLEAVRYIALNPVRAAMVADAADWPWSHHRALAGLTEAPDWLTRIWLWEQLATDESAAQTAYRRFVGEGRGLGPERMTPWLARTSPSGRARRGDAVTLDSAALTDLAASANDVAEWLPRARALGYSQAAIARAGGLSQATVSRLLRALAKAPE